jgi:hypothetical protein
MDEFDPNVELSESEVTTPGDSLKKLVWVAIGLGAVGLVFGLAGMYMANQGAKTAETRVQEVMARPDRTLEINAKIDEINAMLEKLGGELVRLDRMDRQIQEGVRRNLETVSGEVRSLRDGLSDSRLAIGDINKVLQELREATAAPRPAPTTTATTTTPSVSSGSNNDVVSSSSGKIHAVRSGDTLSRIAAEYRVTLEALMQANPSVNPRNLQIGQQIVIP